jgi:hypothetical protein
MTAHDTHRPAPRLASPLLSCLLAAGAAALSAPAAAESSPYYLGGSLGYTQVSNVYRQSASGNDDNVTSASLLAGLDQNFGRQRFTADASLGDNRYSRNRGLNNRSYSLRSGLEWQSVANLSGTVNASSSRSLADFNIGAGVDPIFKKNTERNDELNALARLGVASRYSLELGQGLRRRDFSAAEYNRFVYRERITSFGAYAKPGAHVRVGVAARHKRGQNPRYPTIFLLGIPVATAPNDYTRNDADLTAEWSNGANLTLNGRLSRSRLSNSLPQVRNFSGTTGALGANWQATTRLNLRAQWSRDTGLEGQATTVDLNRVYQNLSVNATYSLTSRVALTGGAARYRNTAQPIGLGGEGFDNTHSYNLGARWEYSRAISLGCQYSRSSRSSSTPQYVYQTHSTGCYGQALLN